MDKKDNQQYGIGHTCLKLEDPKANNKQNKEMKHFKATAIAMATYMHTAVCAHWKEQKYNGRE